MVLAAAGAVDHDALVGLAEKTFGGVPDETPDTSVASLVAKVRTEPVWALVGCTWLCLQSRQQLRTVRTF